MDSMFSIFQKYLQWLHGYGTILFAILFICFGVTTIVATPSLLKVNQQHGVHQLSEAETYVMIDPTRRLDIETISSALYHSDFHPLSQIGTSVMTESAVWWRISLTNTTGQQIFLHLHNIGTDTIDIYIPRHGNQYHHYHYGHLVRDTNSFDRYHWQIAMPLPFVGPISTTIYIRKVARYAIFFYGTAGTYQAVVQSDKERAMFNAAFLGLGCALFLYNFFIFLSLRSKSYLFYLLYIFGFLVHHIFMMGKLHWIVGHEGAMFIHQHGITTLAALASMTIIWFTGYFLHVRKYSQSIYWILAGLFYLQFGMILLEWIGFVYPHITFISRELISLNIGIMSGVCVTSAVVVYHRGNKIARFFLIGWTLWLCTLLYLILMTYGVIATSTFGVYHFLQIGAASEMVLMAIALADRINSLRREKELALQENAQLIQEQNQELEQRVQARTAELELAYNALVSANEAIQHQVAFQNIQHNRIQEKNHQLEEQNQQLSLLNEEKNNLLSIVAHDLKNPLASIIFAAESTRHYLQTTPPKEMDIGERFLRIEAAAERMHDIITNLLNVHTLETGKIKVLPSKFDLTTLMNSIISEYTEAAAAKYIKLNLRCDDAITVVSDRNILAEIIDNLLSNAIKYSLPGKSVHINIMVEDKPTYVNSALLNGKVSFGKQCFVITITDEGPGMTEEDKTKLFTKFARLSAQPTGGESSTGLGLAIVKKFVDLLSGRIWCESEYGHGTTFFVVFPIEYFQQDHRYN